MAHLENHMEEKKYAQADRDADPEMHKSLDDPHLQELEHKKSIDSEDPRITRFTPAEQRKIIHRVDRRLVSVLGLLYMASLMDRTNLSAANIAGYVGRVCRICGY